MNRLFTRVMWAMAAIMICVAWLAVATPGAPSHPAPAARPATAAAIATVR
jgi:hypothetical protein